MERESDIFILKISYIYNWTFKDFRNWKFNILDLFKKNFFFFLFYRKFCKRSYSDEFQFNKKLKNSIANLKDKFIVAAVDKASNNFALICKVI